MSLSSNNTLQLTRAKTERELATPGTSPSARQAYGAAHGAAVMHTSSPGSEKASSQFLSPAMSPMAPVKTPNLGESPPVPPASTLPTTPLDNALIECVPRMHTAARCPHPASNSPTHSLSSYFKALTRLHLRSLDPLQAVEGGARALLSIKPALSPSCHTLVTVAALRALRFLCRQAWIRDQLHTEGAPAAACACVCAGGRA